MRTMKKLIALFVMAGVMTFGIGCEAPKPDTKKTEKVETKTETKVEPKMEEKK